MTGGDRPAARACRARVAWGRGDGVRAVWRPQGVGRVHPTATRLESRSWARWQRPCGLRLHATTARLESRSPRRGCRPEEDSDEAGVEESATARLTRMKQDRVQQVREVALSAPGRRLTAASP